MPKLLLFAPCENVLISQGNAASLIVLLHQITLSGNLPDPIPANAATQMKWHIYAQWETSEEEVGVRFEQKVEMKNSAGETVPAVQTVAQFIPETGKPIHRMIANFTFFPLIPEGQYRLYISLKRPDDNDWNVVGEYPMQLILQHTPAVVTQ